MLDNKRVLATALTEANYKLKFKDNSPFRGFIKNGHVSTIVHGDEITVTNKEMKDLVFENVKNMYTSYKSIQGSLETYISTMIGIVAESKVSKDETRVTLVEIPTILENLYEKKAELPSKPEFENTTVVGALINPELTDEDYLRLLEGITLTGENNVFQELQYVGKTLLRNIPTTHPEQEAEFDRIFAYRHQSAMNRMAMMIHLLNILIESPEDHLFASGMSGDRYTKEVLPVLEDYRARAYHRVIAYLETYKTKEQHKKPVLQVIQDGSTLELFAIKSVYEEYIQECNEIDGASDAFYGLIFQEHNHVLEMTIEDIKSAIPKLNDVLKANLELKGKEGRTSRNIKLAEDFTAHYLTMIDNLVEESPFITELMIDKAKADPDAIPTTEDILNLAYRAIDKTVELNDVIVINICFDILETVLNGVIPYFGTFSRALNKQHFGSTRLEDGACVLGALMEVTADLLMNEVEFIKVV